MTSRFQKSDRRQGFTVMEMIIVVLIIVVLIGILVPTLSYVKKSASNAATQTVLHVISAGIDKYFADFSMYPPSQYIPPASGTTWSGKMTANRGSAMLAEALDGYLGYDLDGGGPANSDGSASTSSTDSAYSFRVRQSTAGGQPYGPYVSPDPKILKVDPVTQDQYFVDYWGNEIIYFRAVPSIINGQSRTVSQVFDTWKTAAFPDSTFKGVFNIADNSAVIDPWARALNQTTPIRDPTSGFPFALPDRPFWQSLGSSAGTNTIAPGDIPTNHDSYLILSAGYDGKFFNADDVLPPLK